MININKEKNMKEKIEQFLASDETTLEIGYQIPSLIIGILDDMGFEGTDDVDSNGWDHDFWYGNITKDDIKLSFSGSWYYGKYILDKLYN